MDEHRTDERQALHPAEHRGYRELYLASRQLVNHWSRLVAALGETPHADVLEQGRERVRGLLTALEPRTARYDLYGGFTAQGLGARIADLRALADRSLDTGLVLRLAVLDMERIATLLAQLGALASARGDDELSGFCREWEASVRAHVESTRVAAISIGDDPDSAAAPLDPSVLGRAAHRVGWALGAVGETVDRVAARRRLRR